MYYIKNKLRTVLNRYRDNYHYGHCDLPNEYGKKVLIVWDIGTNEFTTTTSYFWHQSNYQVKLEIDVWDCLDNIYNDFKRAYREQLGHDLID